jgi:hypothetical protein
MVDIDKLLGIANNHITDPDTIIDPYDMTYVWLSQNAQKFLGDIVGKRVAMDSRSPDGSADYGRLDMVSALNDTKSGRRKIVVQSGSGQRREMLIAYKIIDFEGQPYLVTKAIHD